MIEADEQNGNDETDTAERIVDLEAPPPGCLFRKDAPENGTKDAAEGPCAQDHGEVLRSLTKWHNIAVDHLGERYDAAATNALDAATCQHHGEVCRYRTQDCSDCEEHQGHYK